MNNFDVPSLRAYVQSEEGQLTITAFADHLRVEVGNPAAYLKTVKLAEQEIVDLAIGDILTRLRDMFEPFYTTMPAGHDKGHALRDLLSALTLSLDPFVVKGYKADIWAAIIGGAWHDMGNSFMVRYQDASKRAGHGEAWAWAIYQLTESVLPHSLRTLAAYAILVHTHYLKPVAVKEPQGFSRQPYWGQLEFDGDPKKDGKPYGLAILITRAADRLDNNGVTLAIREWLAKADAVESGGGADIHVDQWYEINKDSFQISFHPTMGKFQVGTNADGSPKMAPTVLEHCLSYMRSNFGLSPYSLADFNFPTLIELMLEKSHQTMSLRDVLIGAREMQQKGSAISLEPVLGMVSLASEDSFARSWGVIQMAWNNLPDKDRAIWAHGLAYIEQAYLQWVKLLGNKALQNPEYEPIVTSVMEELLP